MIDSKYTIIVFNCACCFIIYKAMHVLVNNVSIAVHLHDLSFNFILALTGI